MIMTLAVATAAVVPAMADGTSIALIGATLIDGTGSPPIPDGVIIVKEGRFAAVGSAKSVSIPPDATRIDAKGKYVIPGLMDANVHLYFDIETEPLIKYEGHYDDLIVEAAQVALRNGVTRSSIHGGLASHCGVRAIGSITA